MAKHSYRLDFESVAWHKKSVSIFIEKFWLPILAAILVIVMSTNPMKFDKTQRITLAIAIISLAWFGAHTLEKPKATATQAPTQGSGPDIQLRIRIADLIAEGNRLHDRCQQVPNPYKTPLENYADLANAISDWTSRVENVLAFDLDPSSLEKWRNAVLYGAPEEREHPTIAGRCTYLNLKMITLTEIAKAKTPK